MGWFSCLLGFKAAVKISKMAIITFGRIKNFKISCLVITGILVKAATATFGRFNSLRPSSVILKENIIINPVVILTKVTLLALLSTKIDLFE